MMSMERSTKIIKFVTSGAGVLVLGPNGLINHLVKMHFSKIIFCSRALVRQSTYSNADKGRSYQNWNFHDLGVGVLVQGCGHTKVIHVS